MNTDQKISPAENETAQADPNSLARGFTKGEYRVGVTFNPGGHEQVNDVKKRCAALIDDLDVIANSSTNGEVKRLCALAQTEIESAAMWAVKAITKPAQ